MRQRGQFENFESDHQYESNLESDVRFEIESNHEDSQVPILSNLLVHVYRWNYQYLARVPCVLWVHIILIWKISRYFVNYTVLRVSG